MSFTILPNPVILDRTPLFATTGDSFTFNASITDDQGIAGQWVEYWYDASPHTNVTLTPVGGNYYIRTISIPAHSLNELHYFITAKDTLNYWTNTGNKIITVLDNDAPQWQQQGQNRTMVPQGGKIMFSAQGSDNIALSKAWIATNETGVWQSFSGDNWWNVNWDYSKRIVIDHTKIAADLTNFPVLISYTSSDFIAHVQQDGDDFAFIDATNSTQYPHEIEYYNSGTGELAAWVNIPVLSASQDTILYLYYGNPDCASQQNSVATWNNDFSIVQHLTGSSMSTLKDSTGNHWDITSEGGSPGYNAQGKVGKSVDFNGNNNFLQASGFRLPSDGSYTASAWVYVDGNQGSQRFILEGASDYTLSMNVWYNESFKARVHNSGNISVCYSHTLVNVNNPQWYYVTERADVATGQLNLFINAVCEDESEIPGSIYPENAGLNIGANRYGDDLWMNGKIDEVRISNDVRSDAWIQTEYTNMMSPATFSSVGVERYRSGGSLYGSPLMLSTIPDQFVWTNFTWQNPEIPEGTAVGWRIYYQDSSGNTIATNIMSFRIGTETPILQIQGNCNYQNMSPVTPVSVSIININTGAQWQANIDTNHYSLNLISGVDVSVGQTLRIIARDTDESVNVTDHLVTSSDITSGTLTLNLILRVHYRDLKSFPWYLSSVNTGAMTMKMMMDYLMWNSTLNPLGPPSVYSEQTLYNTYKGTDAVINGSELCSGLNTEIDDYNHGWIYGYFFDPYASTSANDVLKTICIWLDYPVDYYNNIRDVDVPKPGHPNHVPIAVPTGGNYNNWMTIRGIHTDRNAWLPPTQLNVYGFWLNDPKSGGLGANTYVTTQRFLDSYLRTLNVPGDVFNGKYLAITDPSRNTNVNTDKTKITFASTLAQFTTNDINIIQSTKKNSILSAQANSIIIQAAQKAANQVLLYDGTYGPIFTTVKALGKPVLNGDTYTVIFDSATMRFAVQVYTKTGGLAQISINSK
jgi:hypothetical protein